MKVGRFAGENAKALVIGISALATVVVGLGRAELGQRRTRRSRLGGAGPGGEDRGRRAGRARGAPEERLHPALRDRKGTSGGRADGAGRPFQLKRTPARRRGGAGPRQPAPEPGPRRRGAGAATRSSCPAGWMRGCGSWRARGWATPTKRRASCPRRRRHSPSWATDASGLGAFYKDRARYHEARLAELQGNPGEATRIYHEVLEKNPTTSLREEISNRLALLELK